MKSSIKIFTAFVEFISGIVLCNVIVYIAGYLAAIAIPREYFLWFGRHHIAAFLVYDMLAFVLPFFVIGVIWGILTNIVFRSRFLSISLFCGLGCLLAMIYFMFIEGLGEDVYIASLKEPYVLLQFLLHLMAGPCGILVGGYFLSKFRQKEREVLA